MTRPLSELVAALALAGGGRLTRDFHPYRRDYKDADTHPRGFIDLDDRESFAAKEACKEVMRAYGLVERPEWIGHDHHFLSFTAASFDANIDPKR